MEYGRKERGCIGLGIKGGTIATFICGWVLSCLGCELGLYAAAWCWWLVVAEVGAVTYRRVECGYLPCRVGSIPNAGIKVSGGGARIIRFLALTAGQSRVTWLWVRGGGPRFHNVLEGGIGVGWWGVLGAIGLVYHGLGDSRAMGKCGVWVVLSFGLLDVLCGVYVQYDTLSRLIKISYSLSFENQIMLPLHFTYASANWSFSCALCSDYDDVTPSDTYSVQAPSGGVTDWYQSQGYREPGRISRFYTSAGNPVKEILLKLNLPDHRSILMDSKMEVKDSQNFTCIIVEEFSSCCSETHTMSHSLPGIFDASQKAGRSGNLSSSAAYNISSFSKPFSNITFHRSVDVAIYSNKASIHCILNF
ncbi:hypothetical protein Tco_1420977 [Tanacetum coccineum]